MDAGVEIARNLGMAGGFFLLCYVLLKWSVKHWDQIAKEMQEERAQYAVERSGLLAQAAVERNEAAGERKDWHTEIKSMHQERIKQHVKSEEFHSRVKEAHEFQRQEHMEMVKVLQGLNGGRNH